MTPIGKTLERVGKYRIYMPTSGGKAGKGHAKTCTLQVRESNGDGSAIVKKQVQFKVGDKESFKKAFTKARDWCVQNSRPL